MYAVIQTGGKQYRVANGDVITVEKLGGDAGSTLAIEPVLMVNDGKATQIGAPVIEGASVTAEVVEQTRGDKIVVFKKKRRQGYRRTMGHRQELTVLRGARCDRETGDQEKGSGEEEAGCCESRCGSG